MINKTRLINDFMRMVSIDSPSFGERRMGDYIKERLSRLGLSFREDGAASLVDGSCGNIYGFLDGNAPAEPILLCAHMDTVEPSSGKLAVIEENGIIRSGSPAVLGADDFAGIAAILEALTAVIENSIPHRPVEVLFTVAEEAYGKGAAVFDYSNVRSKEAYVLDLAGQVGTAAYKAPSILAFEIAVYGKASHAGFAPGEGIHAIAAAAKAIDSLKMGQNDGETTLNIGRIEGGTATNIVPDKCVIRGEIRGFTHSGAMALAQTVRERFELFAAQAGAAVEFRLSICCTAYSTPVDHPVVRRFESACRALELPFELVSTFGGSDNNVLAERGICGIVPASAMNNVHSTAEYTDCDELFKLARLAARLITDLT